jgi:hypothetical protein
VSSSVSQEIVFCFPLKGIIKGVVGYYPKIGGQAQSRDPSFY